MAILSVDNYIDAVAAQNRGQRLRFHKTVATTNVTDVPHTLWKGPGYPAAGGDPTLGTGGAVVYTDATTGAIIPLVNATGGRRLYLTGGWMAANNGGTILLVDRIASMRLARNQATSAFSPVLDATSRLATGEGAQLVAEVSTALGTTATTRTFTYTNQAGTGSRVTQNVTDAANHVVGRTLMVNSFYVPLASGDVGVRSVESTTLGTAGAATGEYHLSLVRELARVMITAASAAVEFDLAQSVPRLPRIYDDSCLSLLFMADTASATWGVTGELYLLEG